MEDVIDIGAEAVAGLQIADITFDNASTSPFARTHLCVDFVEIFLVAGRKVIKAEDVLVELKKGFENVGADETGDTGDEPGTGSSAKTGLKFVIEHFVFSVLCLAIFNAHGAGDNPSPHRMGRGCKTRNLSAAEFGRWDTETGRQDILFSRECIEFGFNY